VIGREKVHTALAHLEPRLRTPAGAGAPQGDRRAAAEILSKEGSLTFCDEPRHRGEVAKRHRSAKVRDAGLLPEKNAVGFDPNNVGAIIEALAAVGITGEHAAAPPAGAGALAGAVGPGAQADDTRSAHSGLALMDWVVGNVKVEVKGNGNMGNSVRARIDPSRSPA
jgi:phage terminase large subunit-like protein